jgi:hypothetical protein
MRRTFLFAFAAMVASCAGAPMVRDSGADSAPDVSDAADVPDALDVGPDVAADVPDGPTCAADADCDDHVYCNGAERCMPGTTHADARGCVPGTTPCMTGQPCDEVHQVCGGSCAMADADGDGHRATACGGDDCDDNDAHRFPGNAEVCAFDAATMMRTDPTHDEDCDPTTFANPMTHDGDHDGDGYVDHACCNADRNGMSACGTDCDDLTIETGFAGMPYATMVMPTNIHPSEPEVCDGVDNNCNGAIDEGVTESFFHDCDGDMYGDHADPGMVGCTAGQFPQCMGHIDVTNNTDCDDTRASVHPGLPEVCDMAMLDENCNGTANEGCTCVMGTSAPCCSGRGVETCVAGMFSPCSITPMPEVCNGIDDNCNGQVDEGVQTTCYADSDRDGFAPATAAITHLCGACGVGTTPTAPVGANIDCDDTRSAVHPGATEVCDGLDDDCSSGGGPVLAEDVDGDMHTASGYAGCTMGFPKNDCDDNDNRVFGGQTMFFATPHCPSGSGFCTACGACVSLLGLCRTGCTGVVPGSFDYNCDGMATPQPTTTGCNISLCIRPPGCGMSGPMYAGTVACGAPVNYATCGCGGTACMASMSTMPLACN